MNLTGFTDQQKQTLLDLLVIGMYADGNLAEAEEAKIEDVLDTIKFPSEVGSIAFAYIFPDSP